MSEVSLAVNLDSANAAFDPAEAEVARILTELAEAIRKGRAGKFVLMDSNGNRVGSAFLAISDEEA